MEFAVSTVAQWAGSAIITKLVETAYSYLGKRMLPADTEFKAQLSRLETALPQMAAVMGIEEVLKLKYPNSGMHEWLEKFKEAFLAAEDVLDELKYRELEEEVKNRDLDSGSSSSKVELDDKVKNRDLVSGSSSSIVEKKIYSIKKNFSDFSKKIEKKIYGSSDSKDTLKRLSGVVGKLDLVATGVGHFFLFTNALDFHGLANRNISAFSTSNRETTHSTGIRVFGREIEKAMIIEWLKKPASQGNISAFCIVGAGGLGKTTLAQLIFEEISRENHFEKTIWVCVSTSFSVEDITRKILQEVGEKTHGNESLNRLHINLKEKLLSKKVLFILDDVWNDEKICDWEKLIDPLKFVQQGSKILLTTRMKSVADMLAGVLNVDRENLVLQGLEEPELLEQFNKYAFSGYNPDNHRDLQKIGNDIVKKLRGSPLAAKVIGNLLNSNMDFHYWKRILNHDSLINLEQAKDVADVLKLSYYYLPAHLQECFRFCCIFPQDYRFKKDELIKMWMASGFICQELHGGGSQEDIGEEYFNHLYRKSFFEQHHVFKYEYVMHDLIHDLAQNVSKGECCRVELNGQSDVIPCSAQHVSVHESKIERVFNLKNLRTLVITMCRGRFVPPNGSLKETLRLLVIQGSGSCELPEEIGSLMHLRFLKVINTHVDHSYRYLLPNSIYKLYHLQVLEMDYYGPQDSNCEGVETIGITNLVSLRHMKLPNQLKKNIHGVHNLTSLQKLDFFVGWESGHHIDELQMLNNLRSLSIQNLENVGNPIEATNANLSKKESLISLSLNWTKGSNSDDPEQVIDNLQPTGNLKELTIKYYMGHKSPNWTSDCSLPSLERLYCSYMPKWESWAGPHICFGFPNLKELVISECPNLANLPSISFSLLIFEVHGVGLNSLPDMHHGSSITAPAPSFIKPSLREVHITRCPKLLALNGFMLQQNLDLEALEVLAILDCENLVQLPIGAFGKFVSLKHLYIMGIPNLVIVDNQSIFLPAKLKSLKMGNCGELDVPLLESASQLSMLAVLSIENCANITCIPSSENAFASLRSLEICGCDKLIEISSMQQTHTVNQGNNLVSIKISYLTIDQLCLLLIDPLRCLRFVSELYVKKCSGMEALPEQWLLQNSSTLKGLTILDASSIRSLSGRMEMLTALGWIHIHKYHGKENISDLPAFVKDKCISRDDSTCPY